ncbi:MAG: HAMP domain-containing sensor histidine kinase [Polyangia bacterium]|jgi:signal transduction histidine kinase|nr:HAMP domain-containing sensor histidine kinase [Polyangia bacterium]
MSTNSLDLLGPSKPLSDEEVEALSWREIARAGRAIARMRIVILPVMMTLAAFLTYLEPAPWRTWLLLGVGLLGIVVVVRDFFWLKDRSIEPRHVPYFLSVVIIIQASLIAITGGVESPFFVIMVIMAVLPALVLGSLKLFALFLAVPLSVVWLFTLGGLLELFPPLTPSYFGQGVAFAQNPAYSLTQAGIMTTAMILGGLVGIFLRLAIRRGSRAVADARQELLLATSQQNRELLGLTGEIAHELKNPLASIQGLAGLIARRLPQGSREAEQMGVLLGEVRRMGSTLDEFLNFSRPVTGLAARELHPAALIGEVALLHEGQALQRGVALRVDPGDAVPFRCDGRKIKQVITNLVQNAIEATPAGGQITLRTQHGPDRTALIVVEDNGPGLSPEVRERLFVPGTTTKTNGSGIGLVIARAIAEQHGGSLSLEERPGGGCRALLRLPLDPPGTKETTTTGGASDLPDATNATGAEGAGDTHEASR